jgi:hypothetical protein
MTHPDSAQPVSATFRQRAWVDALCLWRLCDGLACRRARKCTGNPHACFPRYAPLLPDDVQDCYNSLCQSREDGLSFEDAMSEVEEAGLDRALEDWRTAVQASLRPRPDQTGAG